MSSGILMCGNFKIDSVSCPSAESTSLTPHGKEERSRHEHGVFRRHLLTRDHGHIPKKQPVAGFLT